MRPRNATSWAGTSMTRWPSRASMSRRWPLATTSRTATSPAGATGSESAGSGGVAGGLADGADDLVEVVDHEQLDGAVGQVQPQPGAQAAGEGVAVGRLAADAGDVAEGGLPVAAAGNGVN